MFQGKTVIVTGAASGFGAEMTSAFAAAGANVLAVDRNSDGVRTLTSELRSQGRNVECLPADVTNSADAENIVSTTVRVFGGLNVLINNAGILGPPSTLEETSDAAFDDMFAVNVKGVFLVSRAALPNFRKQSGGVIINIASGSALRPRAGAVVYSASKGAVVTLTRALALEVAIHGIRVNAICPAIAKTTMARQFVGEADDSEVWDRLGQEIPLGRLVTPHDIAGAALWLASDAASMITGTCLAVDGGRCA